MAAWLIAFIGFVYLIVGIDLIRTGKVGLGISFLAYGAANYGLWLEASK